MATYTQAQIAVMARGVGWPDPDKIARIAMAESSGRADVVNSIGATGLLQVNQPVHVGSHPTWTTSWLKDPINNLRAGLVLYKADRAAGGDGYRPWVSSQGTWGRGGGGGGVVQAADSACDLLEGEAKKLCQERGKDPCEALSGPAYDMCRARNGLPGRDGTVEGMPGDLADAAGQIGRLAQAVAKAGNWLADPANWLRVAYVAGGGLLALTAVTVVIRPYTLGAYRALPIQGTKKAVRRVRFAVRGGEGESSE